ncbi:MAG: 2-amino-4-hydroxy-6-hydroxymethyldihydropteridine diphosphokinase [Chitinophagaceae bacterium]|nr:2-amino-4-hydroxy-6-hydroxymethyldihydropteridine diphosphokinase [Chitinophagaceae bacterium]
MNKVYLPLGGNTWATEKKNINAAIHLIKSIGKKVSTFLRFIKLPHGKYNSAGFLNQVIIIHTNLTAANCLAACLFSEESLGRKRSFKNAQEPLTLIFYFIIKQK